MIVMVYKYMLNRYILTNAVILCVVRKMNPKLKEVYEAMDRQSMTLWHMANRPLLAPVSIEDENHRPRYGFSDELIAKVRSGKNDGTETMLLNWKNTPFVYKEEHLYQMALTKPEKFEFLADTMLFGQAGISKQVGTDRYSGYYFWVFNPKFGALLDAYSGNIADDILNEERTPGMKRFDAFIMQFYPELGGDKKCQ